MNNSDGKTFNTDITADPSKFEQGMRSAVASAGNASKEIDGHFKKIGEAVSRVNGMLLGFTAVLAGGGALKKFISDANEWNATAGKMASQLGISTEKASVLNTALTRLGIDSDLFVSASQKLSKQVQGNSQAFDVLGVKVRDANGAYRPVVEVMGEVNQKLAAIKNPIEQNIAGQQVYGKGWAEVRTILKLTAQQMQESEARARELGLIVGPEGVAMSKQYSAQMRDLNLVGKSIEVQFGNLLLPVFTSIGAVLSGAAVKGSAAFGAALQTVGNIVRVVFDDIKSLVGLIWSGFVSAGQAIAKVFGVEAVEGITLFNNALKVIEIAFVGFRTGVLQAMEVIKGAITGMVQAALTYADVVGRAMVLDFAGAKQAWDAGRQMAEDTARTTWNNVLKIGREGLTKMDEIAMRGAAAPKGALPGGPDVSKGPQYSFKKDKEGSGGADNSRMAMWEANLATVSAALEREGLLEGQFRQRSLADNLAYWQQLLQAEKLTESEKTQLMRKAAEVEMAGIRNTFEVRVKTLQAESEAYKNNFDEKMRIERQVQGMYAAGTKEYEESQKRINALQRGAAEQAKQTAQIKADAERQARLATLALEEQTLKQAETLGLVSHEQVLQEQIRFEEARNEIAAQALLAKLQLAQQDPDRNPEEIARIHAQIEALEQGHQQKIGQMKGDLQATQLAPLVATYQAAETALGNAINGILTRTMSLGQAMRSIWQGISGAIIGEISKILAKKVAAWAVEKGLALMGIGTKAVEAGAGAAAAVANIPYVGPVLAIAALAAVMGAVMSSKSQVPSAFGGYDIPAGINPMTQLHQREMVLPATHADTIRALGEERLASQGSGAPIHIHAQPTDFVRVSDMAKVIKQMNRDFVLVGR